ncbi:MAG: hypothetical protein AB1489_19715 [Acidobacteriota bacterium]
MDKRPQDTQEVKRYELELPTCSPLGEFDLEAFHLFYHDLLKKRDDDAISLLKVTHMLARDDLRKCIHCCAVQRELLGRMFKEARYRDLLLSFPSTTKNVYELIFDYTRAYPGPGETPKRWLTEQARDFLDCTEMFRLDLDALLTRVPSMLSGDKQLLQRELVHGNLLEGCKFLLLLLADQPFIVLLNGREQSGKGLLKIEAFLKEQLGSRLEEQLVEFFLIGGGFLRIENGRLLLGGRSVKVDPIIANPNDRQQLDFLALFHRHKFTLAKGILENETDIEVEVRLPLGLADAF